MYRTKGTQSRGGVRTWVDSMADTFSTVMAVLAVVATIALVGTVVGAFVVAFCR